MKEGGVSMSYVTPEIVSYTSEELVALELACGSCCGGTCCSSGGSRD